MSILSTATKGTAAAKVAKSAAKRPGLVISGAWPAGKLGLKVGKPLVKRRVRLQAEQLSTVARTVGDALAVRAPRLAYDFGLAEPPKPKRTAPRLAAGVVIGASAMYFLEPGHGREHREKVAQLVG